MISDLRVLCISDVHTGHHQTKTEFILDNLRNSLFLSGILSTVQLLLIAGDFFDRLMTYPSPEGRRVDEWIAELLAICAKHGVILRVLEGTPSHDWKQPRRFTDLAKYLDSKVDIKYVDEVSVEYIPSLDTTVLYVPDEVNDDASKTQLQVADLLQSMGLDGVDIGCMHGCFRYQLPIQSVACHNEDYYESIVREVIFIGHHHKHTRRGKVFAQGSFDRLCHGEESPKGFGLYTRKEGVGSTEFIVNPNAKLYKTLDVRNIDVGEIIPHLGTLIEGYPDKSDFRLFVEADSPIPSVAKEILAAYPQFRWSFHREDALEKDVALRVDEEEIPKPISITEDNIRRLLLERLNLTTSEELERFERLMNQVA